MKKLTLPIATLSGAAWVRAFYLTALLTAGATPAQATIRYVKQGGSGTMDGSSWANASPNLQAMINASGAGDEVWVATGTYKPASCPSRTTSFSMKNGVTILGGFPNTGSPAMGDRDWVAYPTVLSGDICTLAANYDNVYHVVSNSNLDSTAVLDGFIIKDGNADGASFPNNVGGGMFNNSSSPTLINCSFSGNSASSGGGMFNNNGSSPSITNCSFNNNYANLGGGMYNYEGASPTITNCSFNNNSATEGGGMFNNIASSPNITYCSFDTNTGTLYGGGMVNANASAPNVTNCIFINNKTNNFDGGGMYNHSSSPSITNCTFISNKAADDGGGIGNVFAPPPSIINCAFINNEANDQGGAIYNLFATSPGITNCSFAGNSANAGGGVYNFDSSPNITNCILWDNGTEIINFGTSSPMVTYSIVKGGYTGTGNLNVNPLFVDPSSNLHLQAGSPAINAGTSTGAPAFDVDGDSRPQGAGFDMGIDEFVCTPPTAVCQNHTAQLDTSGHVTITPANVDGGSAAPCGPQSTSVTPHAFNCSHIGTPQTVILTVTDINNTSATCTATVTVQDNMPPTATCPPALTVACAAQVPVPNPASVTIADNCPPVNVSLVNTTTTDSLCVNRKNITRTYQASDLGGNTATCTHFIAVFDNAQPTFTSVPPNTTVQCNSVPPVGSPSASDNCGGAVAISYNGQTITPGPCIDQYTITRQWTATDLCGNTKTATQTISVIDTQKPNFTSTPPNITVQCHSIPPPATPTATDNCDASVAITYNGQTSTAGPCPNRYTLTRIWTAADNCGNTRTTSQRISVVDTQKPTFTSVPPNTTIHCTDPLPPVGTLTATDNCAGTVAILYLGQTTLNAQCPGTYQIRRTWRATDVCGNTSIASHTIFVIDSQPPTFTSVPPPLTIHCTQPLPPLGNPIASDSCSPPVHITFLGNFPSGSGCSADYTVTRIWRANDLCGNSTTASQIITVQAVPAAPETQERHSAPPTANSLPALAPNPTASDAWLYWNTPQQNVLLRLFDARGQLLWEQQLGAVDAQQRLQIPLRSLAAVSGRYALLIYTTSGTSTRWVSLVDQP